MSYNDEDIELAMMAHDCDRQTAIDSGYAQAVADSRAAEKHHYQMVDLRRVRNELLAETDHWSYQDTPDMTAEQIAYRQALRDITTTYSSLNDVVWPTKP